MGKQYISTASASDAHQLDILAVAITDKYTVTVSSDGYAAFWDNKQDDVHDPKEHVTKKLISTTGIHHIAVYENSLPGLTTKLVILAFACFDSSIQLYTYTNDDIDTFALLDTGKTFNKGFWAPGFFKCPQSKYDQFIATKVDGDASVFALNIAENEETKALDVQVTRKLGDLTASVNSTAFPNSLGVSPTEDPLVAVGYTSGDVVVYTLIGLKALYTFHSTDLQGSSKAGSNSVPRVLRFSPGGTLIAVARDNQSAGSITLYDVKYGENVGSLTASTHSAKTTIGGFAHEGWIMGLDFNEDGSLLASCGFDKCARVWNIESREREATIQVNASDLESTEGIEEVDTSVCSGVAFIKRGVRAGAGGDSNEGLCITSFDRGVRWYREAGGI